MGRGWGGVFGVLSGLLFVWTLRTLGQNLTDTVVTRKQHTLVTTGPYRFVRHPMYLAYVLGDLGYNLQESNAGTLLLVVAGWISLGYRMRAEEDVLARHPDGSAYLTRVGYRFIPGLW